MKTLTFTVEDALLSPLGLSILSGAGLLQNTNNEVHVHRNAQALVEGTAVYKYFIKKVSDGTYSQISGATNTATLKSALQDASSTTNEDVNEYITNLDSYYMGGKDEAIAFAISQVQDTVLEGSATAPATDTSSGKTGAMILRVVDTTNTALSIDVSGALYDGETLCKEAPLYVIKTEADGSLTNTCLKASAVADDGVITLASDAGITDGEVVMVDFYVTTTSAVYEAQIDAENFAGYYYVEADTLFRRQDTGKDMPAVITLPNVKIQSNFTFTMASSGDPSTFTFTMDAFPGYTYFNRTNKVLCAIQVVDDAKEAKYEAKPLFPHPTGFNIDESGSDSVDGTSTDESDDVVQG